MERIWITPTKFLGRKMVQYNPLYFLHISRDWFLIKLFYMDTHISVRNSSHTCNMVNCADNVVASVCSVCTFFSSSEIYRTFRSFERAADCLFAKILQITSICSNLTQKTLCGYKSKFSFAHFPLCFTRMFNINCFLKGGSELFLYEQWPIFPRRFTTNHWQAS